MEHYRARIANLPSLFRPPDRSFARVDKAQRETFEQFTKEYFLKRENLCMVFLLVDSTITPQEVREGCWMDERKHDTDTNFLSLLCCDILSLFLSPQVDVEYASWLADNKVPFCLVFTKTDRRKKGMGSKADNMAQFKRELLKVGPGAPTFETRGIRQQKRVAFAPLASRTTHEPPLPAYRRSSTCRLQWRRVRRTGPGRRGCCT